MLNPFLDCTIEEIIDAYEYFHDIRDYKGCQLVGTAFAACTILNPQALS
jgi:hypothetical protein